MIAVPQRKKRRRMRPEGRPLIAAAAATRAQPLRSGRKEYGQRTGGACDGRGVGLAVGAAAGRGGGSDILSKRACCAVCTSAMSCLTCPRPLASSARLCRIAARPSDIASSFGSKFDDGATGAGAACEMDAIVSLAACRTQVSVFVGADNSVTRGDDWRIHGGCR